MAHANDPADRRSRTLITAAGLRRLDPSRSDDGADAIVVAGGDIVWIGGRADAPATDGQLHLDGWLSPGFVDAHVHATATGLAGEGIDLTSCGSLAEALERVRAHVRTTADDPVLGVGWDETTWPEQRPPRADELRDVAEGRTVMLNRIDSHSCVVDAATLERVVGRGDFGAHIVRDPAGRPTGWVKESAAEAARTDVHARLAPERTERARRAVCDRALGLGIASFHEMGHPGLSGLDDALAWLNGEWPVDVQVWWADMNPDRLPPGAHPGGDLFLDGSIGSSTAAVAGAYHDGGGAGELFHTDEEVTAFFTSATRAGVGAGVHAIGDRAVAQGVSAVEAAARVCGDGAVRACRHRIEHAELISEAQVAAMARLGVVASVQPAFDAVWGGADGLYRRRCGRARALRSNPFAWFADAGVTMAFGSDSTVTPMDPWAAVAAAEHHRGGLGVDRLTAWGSHVHGGRRAAGQTGVGAIAVGARADIAAWDADPLSADDPATLRCEATLVRGVVEFAR